MYKDSRKKIIRVIISIILISVIIFITGIFIIKYQVEGETNIPFEVSKISIIQSIEGIENNGSQERWNYNVNENNDIYIYIKKNPNYGKIEVIDSVTINNIKIEKTNNVGETKLYKPVEDEKKMFINLPENEISEITYFGELQSNIKKLKISNQGGVIAFRYGINNISKFISNSAEEINHSQLLQLSNVKEEDIKTKIIFDVTIKLITNRKYQSTVNVEIPTNEIITKGTNGIEITELNDVVFKRIEN